MGSKMSDKMHILANKRYSIMGAIVASSRPIEFWSASVTEENKYVITDH